MQNAKTKKHETRFKMKVMKHETYFNISGINHETQFQVNTKAQSVLHFKQSHVLRYNVMLSSSVFRVSSILILKRVSCVLVVCCHVLCVGWHFYVKCMLC